MFLSCPYCLYHGTLSAKATSQHKASTDYCNAIFACQVSFHVDAFRKHCLLNGLDDIGLTLQKKSVIDDFESSYMASQSWLFN